MNFSAIGESIARHLQPASVLSVGPEAQPLADVLRERGIDAAAYPLTAFPDRCWDLVVWTGEIDGTQELLVSEAVARLSLAAKAILFCSPNLPVQWLKRLVEAGFRPDSDYKCNQDALLCRRRPAESSPDNTAQERLPVYNREIRLLQVALERQKAAIEQLTSQVSELSTALDTLSRTTADITQSRIWKSLCAMGGWLLTASALIPRRTSPTGTPPAVGQEPAEYERWIADFERRGESAIRQNLEQLPSRPLVSILAQVDRTTLPQLQRSMESVLAQSYPVWELYITTAYSNDDVAAENYLRQVAENDARVHLIPNEASSDICSRQNAALRLASGGYAALLNGSDVLAHNALFRVVELLNRDATVDIIYTDEDQLDEAGCRHQPFFKPDWSPDLLLSCNYIGGLLVFRKTLAEEIGGFVAEMEACYEYDLALRLSGRTSRISHLAEVLYHRGLRSHAGDVAEADAAEHLAVDKHLRSVSSGAYLEVSPVDGRWRVRYPIPPDRRVSIIIPSGGKVDLLDANLVELTSKTDYPLYEIVVIDNSTGIGVEHFVREWARPQTIRYLDWRWKPFNFAAINNTAARSCDSPLLLFLNDDTTVIAPGWLTAMVELGARPEVGAVGAKLLFPNGRIQHAGVAMGLFGCCGHAFKGLESDGRHYFDLPNLVRNVSAVTGACLLVRSSVFWEVGGFDEEHFPVDYNDIDLCLRIGKQRYRVLYTPYALLYHRGSVSRRQVDRYVHTADIQCFHDRWKDVIESDPFYNMNLTRTVEDFSLRKAGECYPTQPS